MNTRQRHGVHAVNRDYLRYDQVTKAHTYRLAETPGDELFDDDFSIRTCDLSQFLGGDPVDRQEFIRSLGEALADIGFAILVGHGVDPSLYSAAEAEVLELFNRTSMTDKMRYRAHRHGSVNQGYFPIKETSDIHPDLVEGWVFCRRAFDIPQPEQGRSCADELWPAAGHEPVFRRIVLAHEQLILPLAQAIFASLGVDPHVYDRRLTRTNIGLRLNHYPPLLGHDADSGAGRLLGHEDVDLFTLLPAPRIEGLQVWNHATARWIRLQAPPGSIILNTGDYLQRISNDRLRSTTHRVGRPRDQAQLAQPRVSFPMAVYVWEDEILEVLPGLGEPRYDPIRAIAFHTRSTSKFYGDDYAVEA